MILKPISLALADVLSKDSVYLPLTAQHKAKLLEHVPAGEETILTITDSVNTEYVRVKNQQGQITLERGVESEAHKFPKGSCVYFEVSVPVVEWLICNYECCKGDCPVQPPRAGGFTLPEGKVGQHYMGVFVFKGDEPMNIGVLGLPDWAKAKQYGVSLVISGDPTAAGEFTVSAAATNATAEVCIQQGTIKVIDS